MIWKTLAELGLTVKERWLRAAEQDRAGVAEVRTVWPKEMPTLNSAKLVFLDETCAMTNMSRARGRAPHGQLLVGDVLRGHWHATAYPRAVWRDRLVASLAVDGATDGPSFPASVEHSLAPGDTAVAYDFSAHLAAGVCGATEERGASLRFWLSYCPDLNPIELVFRQLKRPSRATAPRTVDALWHAIGRLLGHFGRAEYASYLRRCGYPQSVRLRPEGCHELNARLRSRRGATTKLGRKWAVGTRATMLLIGHSHQEPGWQAAGIPNHRP